MGTFTIDVADEAGTREVARALAARLRDGETVLLEGDLGAGKTAFAREVAHGLGVPEEEPVASPTFALVHEYAIPPGPGGRGERLLLHADLYRLSHPDEILELGLEGVIGVSAVALVEWGERFADAIPGVVATVRLTSRGETARTIAIEAPSERGAALLAELGTVVSGASAGPPGDGAPAPSRPGLRG